MLAEDVMAQTISNKAPKITLTSAVYDVKKYDLQQALRNNSIISQGPTNPGRFISLLRDVVQLNYQNVTRDNFNHLIKDMDSAYQDASISNCPYQYQTFGALTAILKFLSEAFSEDFAILKLNQRYSALKFQWQPQPQKSSLLKSFADACCCFFTCCKTNNDNSNEDNDEINPLLSNRNGMK